MLSDAKLAKLLGAVESLIMMAEFFPGELSREHQDVVQAKAALAELRNYLFAKNHK